MAPIPLTMIGIVPGHWFHGSEFTATSMIGMIALGGIIVRQSILIVEFVKIEVAKGVPVKEAAVNGAEIRMRPIFITSLTLMAGAFAILDDPIFNGMAISLLWGAGVGTIMAVIVIPMGCISCRENFYYETSESCERTLSAKFAEIEGEEFAQAQDVVAEYKTPLWMRVYGGIVGLIGWIFVIVPMVINLLKMLFGMLLGMFGSDSTPPPASTPPSAPATPPPSTPPPAPAVADETKSARPAKKEGQTEKKSTVTKKVATKKTVAKKVTVKKAADKKIALKKDTPKPVAPKQVALKQAATKQVAPKKTAPKKATPKQAAPEKVAAVKKGTVKKVAKKKATTKVADKKPVARKTTVAKTATEKPAVKKVAVKKAPSKKTSRSGRRGIRLKDDS